MRTVVRGVVKEDLEVPCLNRVSSGVVLSSRGRSLPHGTFDTELRPSESSPAPIVPGGHECSRNEHLNWFPEGQSLLTGDGTP